MTTCTKVGETTLVATEISAARQDPRGGPETLGGRELLEADPIVSVLTLPLYTNFWSPGLQCP